MRNLILVFGDQLNLDSAAFDDLDTDQDLVWMAEVQEESTHVWTHKARIALFLSAMRHFREELLAKNIPVDFQRLDMRGNRGSFAEELTAAIEKHKPQRLVCVQPGEWRVLDRVRQVANENNLELDIKPDRHFLCSPEEFAEHADGRKQLRLEFFYREMRRKHDILMEGSKPVGGQWNYDAENRGSFGKHGPEDRRKVIGFTPDDITAEVIELVQQKFPDHPGSLEEFDWPVTTEQARRALTDFIKHRLPQFGEYQDAMWTEEPYLYHSRISAAMNLKLLDPREVIDEAVIAYRTGEVPLNGAEGFIRQILGWREYVRGIYWLYMPEYLERNELQAEQPLPEFYWTGETEMNCLHQAIGQTLQYGYAHHIQRLMVTGLFALLLGVDPKAVHEWYLAVYVDAVEWVELPNTLGMSQYAAGSIMASKPYVATGKYIDRMSNYCAGCRFDPKLATGKDACPFTTLYWDFLARHRDSLQSNNRMSLQLRNLDRKDDDEIDSIQAAAKQLRESFA